MATHSLIRPISGPANSRVPSVIFSYLEKVGPDFKEKVVGEDSTSVSTSGLAVAIIDCYITKVYVLFSLYVFC
uniref:Uncharacterized protein n=1 Tax=Amphimedon queenslandica TaxID=400682 RepID=A0A1X7VIR9_AMPQE